jgi:hypothetical protein
MSSDILSKYSVNSEEQTLTYGQLNNISLIHESDEFPQRTSKYCCLCKNNKHILRKCTKFKKIKTLVTSQPYIKDKLETVDENGFCAAGILPYCIIDNKKYILLLKQKRFDFDKGIHLGLNFIGGGRESCYNGFSYRLETSLETALTEFIEEMTPLINKENTFIHCVKESMKNIKRVFWEPHTKYVLYPCEVSFECIFIKHILNIPKNSEAQDFEWICLDDFENELKNPNGKYEIHSYIKEMILEIGSFSSFLS